MNYGDEGEKFYIIVQGVVVVKIPNFQEIPEWDIARHEYQRLKSWKKEFMDPIIEQTRVIRNEILKDLKKKQKEIL